MRWRLFAFVAYRRARGHPARLAAALVTLALAAGSTGAGTWAASQPVTLTVTIPTRYLAAAAALHLEVAAGDRPVVGADLVGDGQSSALFRVPRGEYTVQLSVIDENGTSLLVARPVPIRLAGDRTLTVGEGPDETLISPDD